MSLHNLHHYFSLMRDARAAILEGRFAAFARDTLEAIDRHEHSGRRLGPAPGRLELG